MPAEQNERTAEGEPIVRLAAPAMGTRFECVLVGGGGDDAARLRAIGEAALAEIVEWHRQLSAFTSSSTLAHVNRNAAAHPVRIDGDFFALLRLCREIWEASEGAFDVTVGGLMERWGLHPSARSSKNNDEPADCSAVSATDEKPERVSMADVELDEASQSVRYRRPGVRIDLGAVAKGFALDRAGEILREHGVTRALLHGGTSSVIAMGPGMSEASFDAHDAAAEEGWKIALYGSRSRHVVRLRDAALGVSREDGRMVETTQGRVGHVIDPRTGVPTSLKRDRGVETAAVAAESAAAADAWSTALFVQGTRPRAMPARYTAWVARDTGLWERLDSPTE